MREEFTNFYFKTIINVIKENKTLVLLLPTLIGSIFQFVSLFLVDYNLVYIRFYSVTQVIADSFIFIFLIVINYLLNFVFIRILFDLNKYESKNSISLKFITYSFLATIPLLYVIYIFVAEYSKYEFDYIIFSVIFFIFYLIIFYINCLGVLKNKKYESYFLVFGAISIVLISIKIINKNYLDLSNNLNLEKKTTSIKEELKNNKVILKYFNDKYIFYKIGDNGKIYIEKTADVF